MIAIVGLVEAGEREDVAEHRAAGERPDEGRNGERPAAVSLVQPGADRHREKDQEQRGDERRDGDLGPDLRLRRSLLDRGDAGAGDLVSLDQPSRERSAEDAAGDEPVRRAGDRELDRAGDPVLLDELRAPGGPGPVAADERDRSGDQAFTR
jgi:hypothetical protein